MKLILIRHGQSQINLPDFKSENPADWDAALTQLGARQAGKLAAWLPLHFPEVASIYTSTMLRAVQTAQPVAKAYGMKFIGEDHLREFTQNARDHRAYKPEESPTKFVDTPFYADPYFSRILDREDGEAWVHVRARVGSFIEALNSSHKEDTVLVICHGGVINAAIDHFFNTGITRTHDIWIKNTGVTYCEYTGTTAFERWRIHYINLLDHLSQFPDLIS